MNMSIDLKYAWRQLLNKPLFTLVSIFIVAFGLALTLYCYTLLMELVFKPLTLGEDQRQVYAIEGGFDKNHNERRGIDAIDYQHIKAKSTTIANMGLYVEATTLLSSDEARQYTSKLNASWVEWNIFDFSGVQPIHGRGIRPEDHYLGAEPVIVLGHQTFVSQFSENPDIVGQMVMVNGKQTRIVGIMPEGYRFPSHTDGWLPLEHNYISPIERSSDSLFVYAKLKPSASIQQLQNELKVINKEIAADIPDNMSWRFTRDGRYLTVNSYKKANVHVMTYYNFFVSLFAMVLFVWLLTCVNIGNLLLSRVNERAKEIAIKLALGISKLRLITQMVLESTIICIVGGFIAFLLTSTALHMTNLFFLDMFQIDGRQPFWWNISFANDGVLILFLSVLITIVFTGLLPAWKAIYTDFNGVLRDGTRGAIGKGASRISKLLVITEMYLSCAVIIIAVTIMATSYFASQADYGVETENRLVSRLHLPEESYPVRNDHPDAILDRQARSIVLYELKTELEAHDTIKGVALMSSLPGTGEGSSYVEIEGREGEFYDENPRVNTESIAKNSWSAVGMSLIDGRDFDYRDTEGVMGNVIVNEAIANDYFPDGDAVGSRIRRVWASGQREWQTIVGVVSNTYHGSTMSTSSERYTMYRLFDNDGRTRISLALHYENTEAEAKTLLQQMINLVEPRLGVYRVQSYQSLIDSPMKLINAVTRIFMFAGLVALLLAASGIYAIYANSIAQKTQEIGVRRALGAPDSHIYSLFIVQAVWQLLIGLTIGVCLAFFALDLISDAMNIDSFSYKLAFIGVPLIIIVIVLVATVLPSRAVVSGTPSKALNYS